MHVLISCEALGRQVKEALAELGYDSDVSHTIAQFRNSLIPGRRYLLVADYLLPEGDCRNLLLDLLETDSHPAGLLVMSELFGFEHFLQEAGECYSQRDAPFLFLEKPFDRLELGELLLRLTQGFEGHIFGCLRLSKYNYREIGKLGPILKALRENLGLDRGAVVSVARRHDLFISEERLEQIEADESGAGVAAVEWYTLTHILYESADCLNMGVDLWSHLSRVRIALQEKTYPYLMNFVLRQKLVTLSRRERIEERYSRVVHKTGYVN